MYITSVNTLYAIVLILFFLHFIGDFVLQSHWMASNKSKNVKALMAHVGIYACVIAVLPTIMLVLQMISCFSWLVFVVLNLVIHFIIDFTTSKITSKLWMKQSWHNFFVVVGLDQFLHALTLVTTLAWLLDNLKIVSSSMALG
jgi:hypothetical protein